MDPIVPPAPPSSAPSGDKVNPYGIRVHAPMKRKTNGPKAPCDLCGLPTDNEFVHKGDVVEIEGSPSEVEAMISSSGLFERHRDGTLCSFEDCEKRHLGDEVH